MYNDEQVLLLPEIHQSHIHLEEWRIRKKTSLKLIGYLKKKKKPLNILEIGCGNGWLSAQLAAINGAEVIGLDSNEIEILQASRLFKKDNLAFVYGNFPAPILDGKQFDIILFAASFQYFSSVANVINNCQEYLSEAGEIHIVDTFFYNKNQLAAAAERTKIYYGKIGYPEMNNHYFHHSISDFKAFNYQIKYNPTTLWSRIFNKNPFYWVMIKYTSPR